MSDQFIIDWFGGDRLAKHPANPAYPNGIDVRLGPDLINAPRCVAQLPYPASGCGYYAVRCKRCNVGYAITAAGRADDPRSVEVMCANRASVSLCEQGKTTLLGTLAGPIKVRLKE